MISNPVLLFGPVGIEVLIILFLLIFLFGANKIPKLANSIGRSTKELKQGRKEVEEELENHGDR